MEQRANDSVTRILDVAGSAGSAAELEKFRRNVTVLFTDMKGSTAYFEKHGDAAGLLLVHRLNSMFGEAVERHGGRVIKTIGDAVMACFDQQAGAVSAAIEMQQALAMDNASKGSEPILVRIGLNYGPGIVKSNDVFGDVVNVASRVESAAAPDQILISNSLFQEVAKTGKFRVRGAGKFALKGKSEEQELFEVFWRDGDEDLHSASHSLVMQAPQAQRVAFRLMQIRNDGKQAREFELKSQLTIGRLNGDITFPHDGCMISPHVRLVVDKGQLFVDPVGEAVTFFSLVGPWRLQDGDLVRMGSQVMAFRVNTAALEMASMNGTDIIELSAVLQYPVAEFVSTIGDNKRYSVLSGNVSFGRTKATHTFPTDSSMSRSHAKAFHRGEDFFLEDIGSTNGTFVMARGKTPIPDGVTLLVGGQLLKVVRQV